MINAREFNPKLECPGPKCVKNNVKGVLVLQVKQSRFLSYQEVKIQEPSDQVPIGHVPRAMKVLARGEVTRQCTPGDIVTITGIYMPSPFFGYKAMRTGLTHDTFLDAFKIVKDKQNFKETLLTP